MSAMDIRRQRGAIKAKLTRLNTRSDKLQENEDDLREKVEVYLTKLDEINDEYKRIYAQLESRLKGELEDQDVEDEAEFEDNCINIQVKLKRLVRSVPKSLDEDKACGDDAIVRVLEQQAAMMQQFAQRSGAAETPAGVGNEVLTRLIEQQNELMRTIAAANNGGARGGNANQESRVKLPTVEMPKFDGRMEDWKRFSETYQSLIHNNDSIPNVQKFQYLLSSLTGAAAKIIEAIELTGENYTVAWELLKKRFDDPRAIKKKHIQCLFALPRVEKESSSAIRGLSDNATKHLRVLKSMGLPTDEWGELIVHIIETKLDTVTLRAWEQDERSRDANLDGLTDFLQQRCQILERIEARSKTSDIYRKADNDRAHSKNRNQGKSSSNEKVPALTVTEEAGRCHMCRGNHYVYQCENFMALSIEDRIKEVQRLKLCTNCLRNDHFVKSCKMGSCRVCSKRHNTLCHRPSVNEDAAKAVQESEGGGKESSSKSSNVAVHHASGDPKRRHVLMATAIVNVERRSGDSVPLRILFDSGSEANFITKVACNKLGVKLDRAQETITGINERESKVVHSCQISLRSRHSNFRIDTVYCLVVPTIAKRLPSVELDARTLKIPLNVKLADVEFYKPSAIDILLGAEYFFDVMQTEKIELGEKQPSLRNTKFGWIIAGKLLSEDSTNISCNHESVVALTCSLGQGETLDENLKRFWEIENVESKIQTFSASEKQCEQIFEETVTRELSGRFSVKLPFKADPNNLGESRNAALKRLLYLERRFNSNNVLRERYTQFMREYIDLGHMSLVSDTAEDEQRKPLYLPHHGVIKESSTSTKLRVVFDASNKTSTGLSLNDVLHVGPTLQSNLIEIVMRFRCYNIALTADLKKMYRQVLVHPNDRDYQRILWRFSTSEKVSEFRLNTVTYGQASSSYLAVKCVRTLAEQASESHRKAARVILDEMYVDDLMTGADDIDSAIELQGQLTELLQEGGFEIHKWCTSHPESLKHVASEDREELAKRAIDANETIRTLGLEWDPNSDQFQFAVSKTKSATTKRQILSEISKIFDPLGLIGPILTTAKVLMQETWKLESQWDDALPLTFIQEWEKFRQNLDGVSTISIPRRVISSERPARLYLQGFCDASERAYGACVYVQVENAEGAFSSRLLCSKSRVAPLRPMSIPRLELSSALLLARLITSARNGLVRQVDDIQVWTDSRVALCWIRGDPARWKPFVSNRVIEITELVPAEHWSHVAGEDNPADVISRGSGVKQLEQSDLWWTGPSWLQKRGPVLHLDSSKELAEEICATIDVERRSEKRTYKVDFQGERVALGLLEKFSSLTKIERIMAYCIRFLSNAKKGVAERNFDRLSAVELQEAQIQLIQCEQEVHFTEEISALSKNQRVSSSSNLVRLHPLLDKRGLLRVGGRLQHSILSFDQRHPIILPAKSSFSRLLFEREHLRLLHASQLLLLSTIREKYWPLNGRNISRQVCHACVWCTRHKPRESSQIMGSLPSERVKPSRPFTFTGVDFAGPITTLVNKGRGRKTNKSYIALFVCFATKAIHLEAVSELSTAAFLASFRRFVGRRGRPRIMHSDNGTNFIGAHRELREIYQFLQNEMEGEMGDIISNERVDWKFLPPGSPHMGGLWEAGVKSCKYHLKRYMGQSLLTFEELTTVLVQIEACLNSRPISALSNDPSDLQPLTPAHFLVGESLTGLPDLDVTEISLNRLNRWQLIQRIAQDFWKRWSTEYICALQGRSKWSKDEPNLSLGDLVIIKDENLPPIRWRMGRVVELYPGTDKRIRVVTVRTANGHIKRSIAKLCKLPVSTTMKNDES